MDFQKRILNQVKPKVRRAFRGIPIWVHDFDHTKAVVALGRQIVKGEKKLIESRGWDFDKFSFLVELACWLHDLGRTVETKPTFWGEKFNHAQESEKLARKVLKDVIPGRLKAGPGIYENNNFINIDSGSAAGMTREDLELVLQAVLEHNQPTPAHPDNLISRFLQDADRGEGFGWRGMIMVLNYNKVITTGKRIGEAQCRQAFLAQWPRVIADEKLQKKAIHWLTFQSSWYNGGPALAKNDRHKFSGVKVCPLYTETAKRIYRQKYLITKKYLEELKTT